MLLLFSFSLVVQEFRQRGQDEDEDHFHQSKSGDRSIDIGATPEIPETDDLEISSVIERRRAYEDDGADEMFHTPLKNQNLLRPEHFWTRTEQQQPHSSSFFEGMTHVPNVVPFETRLSEQTVAWLQRDTTPEDYGGTTSSESEGTTSSREEAAAASSSPVSALLDSATGQLSHNYLHDVQHFAWLSEHHQDLLVRSREESLSLLERTTPGPPSSEGKTVPSSSSNVFGSITQLLQQGANIISGVVHPNLAHKTPATALQNSGDDPKKLFGTNQEGAHEASQIINRNAANVGVFNTVDPKAVPLSDNRRDYAVTK